MTDRRIDMDMDEYEESYQTRKGKRYRGYFMDEASIPLWTPDKNDHVIDIVPYQAGEWDPRVRLGSVKAGKWVYKYDFYVHEKIGISDLTHICLKNTYMTPCPVCEEIESMKRKEGGIDKETWKLVKPKRRTLYKVWVHNNEAEENKGAQVLDISHFHLEQKLIIIARKRKGGGFVPFSDPDQGCLICFTRLGIGAENTAYDGYKFEPRENSSIPDTILRETVIGSLDSLVYVPTYEEVKRLIFSGGPVVYKEGEDPEEDVPDYSSEFPRTSKSYNNPLPVRNKCYMGKKFGQSFRQTDGCGECPSICYSECAEEYNKLEAAAAK